MKIYLEIPQKNGKNVGSHFYENTPSDINLPLTNPFKLLLCMFLFNLSMV